MCTRVYTRIVWIYTCAHVHIGSVSVHVCACVHEGSCGCVQMYLCMCVCVWPGGMWLHGHASWRLLTGSLEDSLAGSAAEGAGSRRARGLGLTVGEELVEDRNTVEVSAEPTGLVGVFDVQLELE